MNHTSDQHPWFRVGAREPRLAVPRLLRLARREARGEARRRRLPRPGGLELGVQRAGRASGTCTASTPTSPTSTSPTRGCATRSRRSWASGSTTGCRASASTPSRSSSSRSGLPEGRDRRPARAAARPARLPQPPQRRGDPARRGQPARRRAARVPRRRGRRRAAHALRLPRQPGAVPVARARRRRAAAPRRCASAPAIPDAASLARFVRNHDELTLDKLDRRRARGGLRALRPRRGHAALRPRAAPPPAADARRRPARRSGWSTRSRSRCPARRCCSTARRSAWARTSRSTGGSACARRCSGRPSRNGGFSTAGTRELVRPLTEGAFGPEHVNVDRAAPRPGLAAELVRAPDPPPARVPGDRLRHARAARRRTRRSVLAHRCDWEGSTVVAVHELAGRGGRGRAAGRRRRGARRPVRRRRARAAGDAAPRAATPRTGSACGATGVRLPP